MQIPGFCLQHWKGRERGKPQGKGEGGREGRGMKISTTLINITQPDTHKSKLSGFN
jgi:hypothetical protein